jgi:hypothetical protein
MASCFFLINIPASKAKNYKYVLCAIDAFTRKVWLEAMKTKSSEASAVAFQEILERANAKPRSITTDNDSGFLKGDAQGGAADENTFEQLLERKGIQISTNAMRDHHALGIIDRFARTFKEALTQSMLRDKTSDWTQFVQEIQDNYNDTRHMAIKDRKSTRLNSSH